MFDIYIYSVCAWCVWYLQTCAHYTRQHTYSHFFWFVQLFVAKDSMQSETNIVLHIIIDTFFNYDSFVTSTSIMSQTLQNHTTPNDSPPKMGGVNTLKLVAFAHCFKPFAHLVSVSQALFYVQCTHINIYIHIYYK